MVKITDGTITWELTCDQWALLDETPPAGFAVTENTCSTYGLQFFAPFASFDLSNGNGTVTSVGLELPDITYDVSGSPVTEVGVLVGTYIYQPAKFVLIGPVSGADDTPTWRQIVIGDLAAGTATTGQVITYNGTTWVASTPTVYTDEQAQDAVGSILVDSAEIDFTYNDGTPSITALLIVTGVTAGTYGSASVVPVFTVDSKGRLTSVTNTNIAIAASAIISGILPIARGGTGLGSLGSALQYLRVNAGGTALEYATLPTGLTGTGVAGQVAFWSGTSALTGENELFYDTANNRLSIGTNTGTANLIVTRASTTTATISNFFANCSTLLLAYLQNTNTSGGQAVFEINTTGTTANTAQAATRYSAGASNWQVGAQRLASGNQFVISNDSVLNTTQVLIIGNSLTGSFGALPVIIALVNFNFTGTGGIKLPVGDNSQRPTVSAAYGTIRANNQIGGVEYYNQKGTWSRLSCIVGPGGSGFVAGAGAGTSPTITTIAASDKKGVINIQAGTSPGAAGTTIITVNYGVAYSELPIVILGRNNSTGSTINFYVATFGTTGFTIAADTALTASATYAISYIVQD